MVAPSRILHVVNDLNTGGAQTLIEALSRCSANEVHVLVLQGRGDLSDRIEAVATSVTYVGMSKRRPMFFRARRVLQGTVRDIDATVVHSHLVQSDLLSLLAAHRRPRVTTVHTSGGHESGRLSRLLGRLLSKMRHKFDAVVACSPSAQQYVRDTMVQGEPLLVYNGTALPTVWGRIPAGVSPAVLSLSRWHPMKDHATLLAAYAEYLDQASCHSATLICAGSGVTKENVALRDMIDVAEVTGKVRVLGAIADVPGILRTVDLLVISSCDGEALPMAGIEALAHGVPVLTTDVGDCRELVVDTSLLVEPRNPDALAEALSWFYGRTELERNALASQARQLASEKFDARLTARSYDAIYTLLEGVDRNG